MPLPIGHLLAPPPCDLALNLSPGIYGDALCNFPLGTFPGLRKLGEGTGSIPKKY